MSYIDNTWHRFHTFNDVFILGRAGNNVKAKANAHRTELVHKRKVDEEINAETWAESTKRCKIPTGQDYISSEINISMGLNADINFPKIHMMSDWAQQIPRYAALQQCAGKRHEQAHETNLKDGWNASNDHLNYLL